jgi:hypothetical protein
MPPTSTDEEIRALAEHFRAWGVDDPEGWARSQVKESINQYARLVFLRGAWRSVISDSDTAWIDRHISESEKRPDAPGAGAGHALGRLIASGANRDDLSELVRVMQWEVLASLAYQLADPGTVKYPSATVPRVAWALFEVDKRGDPVAEIGMLHESVLETDPAGREMRPRKSPGAK